MADNKMMMGILKGLVTILLSSLLGLISIMYWDMRHDVTDLMTSQSSTDKKLDSFDKKLDSLIITQITKEQFVQLVDSVQSSEIKRGFEAINDKIEDFHK